MFFAFAEFTKKEVCRIRLDFAGRFKYIDGLFKLFSGIKFLTLMNDDFLKIARENQKKAFEIIQKLKIYPAWEKAGATVNLIGSLQTGLLMKHLDIDFHIYTPVLKLSDSFGAIEKSPKITALKNRIRQSAVGAGRLFGMARFLQRRRPEYLADRHDAYR